MERCNPKWVVGWCGAYHTWCIVSLFIGIAFSLLLVIGDAMNTTLGLESMSWLALAIAAFAVSIANCLSWVLTVYLKALETKREE